MTPRTRAWWHAVADHADDPSAATPADVRDPWADRPLEIAALTTAQQAVLAGLDDQPTGPRLDGLAAELDDHDDNDDLAGDQPGVPRLRPRPTATPHARSHPAPRTSDPAPGRVADGAAPGRTADDVAPGDASGGTGHTASGRTAGDPAPGRVPDGGAGGAGPGRGPGDGTGSAPGDPGRDGPHTRTRWTEQEQQEG